MKFYEVLAEHYDRIFPFEEEIFAFLRDRFEGRTSLVDVACGTGTYALALASASRRVAGADLDEEMIKSANGKARTAGLSSRVAFFVADMRELSEKTGSGFDGLYCIGNSLVHLADRNEVLKTLKGFADILVPGGRTLIQIINFDRIVKKEIRELPTLRGDGVEFVRRYLPGDDSAHVRFETELVLKRTEEKRLVQAVPLLILKSTDLAGAAEEAGFRGIRFYGSYRGTPYSRDDSFLTILEAERG